MSDEWNNATPVVVDEKRARSERGTRSGLDGVSPHQEGLPPHDELAEQGVLGCVMLEPPCLRVVVERFGGNSHVFYDLRNRMVFEVLMSLDAESKGIDLITLQSALSRRRQLDEVGGISYLAGLQDKTPSAANIEYYLEILREKFMARLILQQSGDMMGLVSRLQGVTEPVLARLEEQRKAFEVELHRGAVTPRYIKAAGDFAEAVWEEFFGKVSAEEPGWTLPIEFKLKLRLKEVTLVTGDDGCGKSTFLNYCCLHIAQQMAPGERVMIASFEEPPETQLWGLTVQLCGTREFPDSDTGRARFMKSMAWLNSRLTFYAFLGIGDWRDVLDSFRYAAKNLGVKMFVLDSVMRVGIQDDDYATQGLFASLIGQFAIEFNVHVVLVIHENKGADKGKARVRGSKLWTANASNVVKIERNMDKGEKLDDLWEDLLAERRSQKPNAAAIQAIEKEREEIKRKWDSHAVLLKQRRKGTQQNGSKYFWYDWRNFQFKEHQADQPVNWLELWTKKDRAPEPERDVTDGWPAANGDTEQIDVEL